MTWARVARPHVVRPPARLMAVGVSDLPLALGDVPVSARPFPSTIAAHRPAMRRRGMSRTCGKARRESAVHCARDARSRKDGVLTRVAAPSWNGVVAHRWSVASDQ